MSTSNGKSAILTIKEIAGYLKKVTQRTIYRLTTARKIPAFKIRGIWHFRTTDINGWIAAQWRKAEEKRTLARPGLRG